MLSVLLVLIAITITTSRDGFARLREPDVVYFGAVTGGVKGNVVTMKLEADGSTLQTATVKDDLSFVLRVPMDSVEPRVAGAARSGDKVVLYLGTKVLNSVVIPERGSLINLSLAAANPTLAEWQKLHPGDDGSGDRNRNGISDLQDYLNGDDPYRVWNVLTLSTLADLSITTDPTLNVAGTVTDNGSGIGVKGVTVNGLTALLTNGSFSVGVPLVDGPNLITATATDNADHNTIDTRTITLDPIAPTLVVSTPADNSLTGKSFITVTGSVNEPTTVVSAKVNNGSATGAAMTGVNFTVTLNLASGQNTIDITAQNLAGKVSSVKRTVVSDTAAPTLAVIVPAQDISTTLKSLILQGTVSDAQSTPSVTITMDGQTFTPVVTNDSFKQELALPDAKQYAIVVTATDQAGNSSTVQRNVIAGNDMAKMLADAVMACQHAYGQTTLPEADKLRIDCAPLGANGKPNPNGVVDMGDVIILLRRVLGLVNW
jgi:hypothetical protein